MAVRGPHAESLAAADVWGTGGKVNLQDVGSVANCCHAR